MKTILTTIIAITLSFAALAQQPFEQYGYKVKVLTLSQGKYEEFFDQDTIVQIGSVMFNTVTNTITGFAVQDTVYSEANFEPQIISKFLSPDPLANQYYDLSPYNFVANNPIKYTDPDGRQIVDANGNIVKVLINEDADGNKTASFEFAEGTNKKTIRKFNRNGGKVINSMIGTDTGSELVNAAIESKDNIHISISSEIRINALGSTKSVGVNSIVTESGEIAEVNRNIEVTIYAGTVDLLTNPESQGFELSNIGEKTQNTMDLWKENSLTRDQKIASVGGHELYHATKGNRGAPESDSQHQKAWDAGDIIIKEFGKKNKKKP